MRWTQLSLRTLKQAPKDIELISHRYLTRAGFIKQYAAGIYATLPLGKRCFHKIEAIIRNDINLAGGLELSMPCLSTKELWQRSGRDEKIGNEMFRLQDRHQQDFVLNMTHEESIVSIAKTEIISYKQLPIMYYQIQTKFRDEPRPRGGMIRLREFIMTDAYSFHSSEEDLQKFYKKMIGVYEKIFHRCGFSQFIIVESNNGIFGGHYSHEFQLLAPSGEDRLYLCPSCDYKTNAEKTETNTCPKCSTTLESRRGIELGNNFHLGSFYSEKMGAYYLNQEGKQEAALMGCYGIGVSRILPAIIEENHDAAGMIFPISISPFEIHLCVLSYRESSIREEADRIYHILKENKLAVFFDDRDQKAGTKFADADLIGIPFRMVISPKTLENNEIEWTRRDKTIQAQRIQISGLLERIIQDVETEYAKYSINKEF